VNPESAITLQDEIYKKKWTDHQIILNTTSLILKWFEKHHVPKNPLISSPQRFIKTN